MKHPVRFLGRIWQQRMKAKFDMTERPLTAKEYGQLKTLRLHLDDLTQELIEWVVDPVNWWHFCQEVRADWKMSFVPDYPDIGFLLARRGVALRVMRSKLSESGTNIEFVKKLDEKEFQRIKSLLIAAYVQGYPERLAKIESAETLIDIQKIFNEIIDATQADSADEVPLQTLA